MTRIVLRSIVGLMVVAISSACPGQAAQPDLEPARSATRQIRRQGPVEVTLELDRLKAHVAEPITLQLTVDAPVGTQITFPAPEQSLGRLSLIETDAVADLPVDNRPERRRWQKLFRLESLETGGHSIGAMKIGYQLPDTASDVARVDHESPGLRGELVTEPMSIEIASVLQPEDDPTRYRDIKDVVQVPEKVDSPSARAPIAIGIAAAVAMTALVGALIWKRRRRVDDLAQMALEEVSQMEAVYGSGGMTLEEVYSHLTSLLRDYLAVVWAIPASAQSSDELLRELDTRLTAEPERKPACEHLRAFLQRADQIKFSASSETDQDGGPSPFDSARGLLEELKPDPDTTSRRGSA